LDSQRESRVCFLLSFARGQGSHPMQPIIIHQSY
jgi:hypothetical protein